MKSTPYPTQTDWRERSTLSIEEAATVVGIGRSAAYAAAHSGDLPTVRIGRRMLVPTARLRAMLGENENSATVRGRDAVQKAAEGDGHAPVYGHR